MVRSLLSSIRACLDVQAMLISFPRSALNSGAKTFMADFEGSSFLFFTSHLASMLKLHLSSLKTPTLRHGTTKSMDRSTFEMLSGSSPSSIITLRTLHADLACPFLFASEGPSLSTPEGSRTSLTRTLPSSSSGKPFLPLFCPHRTLS
jgi:hypothetical protein